MELTLSYGRSGLAISLPQELRPTVVRTRPMEPIADPARAVAGAIRVRKARSACIAICDITRPVPNGILLPPLLESLAEAGVPREDTRILVATGLHRPNEGAELQEVVGSREVLARYRVENHVARDRAAHADLGVTTSGVPILLDRRFVEAELRIVVGLVEPHFMAGWSGGRKVISPGIAGEETILAFHSPRFLEHPRASSCILDGNPLHGAQLEIARAVGEVLALNVVIDAERRVGFVSFGEVVESHREAVAFARRHAVVSLPRRFHTVLTTGAGYPLDRTYYQTVKGMVGATGILEPGGTIVVASECSEGMGSREFVEAQRLLCERGVDGFLETIGSRRRANVDEWQTEMLLRAARLGTIELYAPALEPADRRLTFVRSTESVVEAVLASARAHGDPEVAVIPEGPYVIPKAEGGKQ